MQKGGRGGWVSVGQRKAELNNDEAQSRGMQQDLQCNVQRSSSLCAENEPCTRIHILSPILDPPSHLHRACVLSPTCACCERPRDDGGFVLLAKTCLHGLYPIIDTRPGDDDDDFLVVKKRNVFDSDNDGGSSSDDGGADAVPDAASLEAAGRLPKKKKKQKIKVGKVRVRPKGGKRVRDQRGR